MPPAKPPRKPTHQFWEIAEQRENFRVTGDMTITHSSENDVFVVHRQDKTEIGNYKTGQFYTEIPSHRIASNQMVDDPRAVLSPDGQIYAFTPGGNSDIELWDTKTGKLTRRITASPPPKSVAGSRHWISGMDISRDGSTLGVCYIDGTVKLWRIK
jgi:WD40 repeat protein